MKRKSVDARIKAVGDGESGEFEAIVSVFGNVDSYGDVVLPGAFSESLKAYEEGSRSLPAVFAHGSDAVGNFIGRVVEAKETDEGLYVRAALYLDAEKYGAEIADRAKAVRALMADGVLTQFSFAYGVKEWAAAKRDGNDVIELKALDLYEVGPCLVGANQETRLVGVKSADNVVVKAADHVSEVRAVLESLAKFADEIGEKVAELLAALDGDGDDGDGEGAGNDDPNEGGDGAGGADDDAKALDALTNALLGLPSK